jgi:hypothetical protein
MGEEEVDGDGGCLMFDVLMFDVVMLMFDVNGLMFDV